MANVATVFDAAMSFMDELSQSGQAQTADTKEYEYRTPGILNMLIAEHNMLTGDETDWKPITSLADEVPVGMTYAFGILPYGLAAGLLVDENAAAASFFQQRYEELRDRYIRTRAGEIAEITNVYGTIEHGEHARW